MVRRRRPRRDHVLALHAQPRGEGVFGVRPSQSITPRSAATGTDPSDLEPVGAPTSRAAAAGADTPSLDERLVLLVGRLVYEKGFQPGASDALGRR